MKQDLKETYCVLIYIIMFIPWLILTLLVEWIYKPIDKLMVYSSQFIDDRCRNLNDNSK